MASNNLAKIRGKYDLSQTELAKKLGITKQGVSFAEGGRCSVKIATAVADIFDENVFEILGTDVLKILPETEEDKEVLRKIMKNLLGE